MRRFVQCLGVLVLGLCPTTLRGATGELTPEDFFEVVELTVPADARVAAVALSERIYSRLTRWDAADLRVWNAARERVAYDLVTPTAAAVATERELALFALPPATSGATQQSVRAQVQLSAGGAILRVTGPTGASRAQSYVIDLGESDEPISGELVLSWEPEEARNVVARFRLQASQDLDSWRTVLASASLAELSVATPGSPRLDVLRDRVSFGNSGARYLLLTWLGETQLELDGATLLTSDHTYERRTIEVAVAPEPWRDDLPAAPKISKGMVAFDYELEGARLVDRVGVRFQEPGSLAEVRLWVLHDGARPRWTVAHEGVAYHLGDASESIVSEPVAISPRRIRRIRAELAEESALSLGPDAPTLAVGYRPDTLRFLPRGEGPFLLSYGRWELESGASDLEPVLASLDGEAIAEVDLGALVQEGTRTVSPDTDTSYRQLLWVLLLASVILLAFMAWRLARSG